MNYAKTSYFFKFSLYLFNLPSFGVLRVLNSSMCGFYTLSVQIWVVYISKQKADQFALHMYLWAAGRVTFQTRILGQIPGR